jgi:hypothetical protein
MSESDFVDMTRNGALCNAAGEIGAREFEAILRGEIITYLQVVIRKGWGEIITWLQLGTGIAAWASERGSRGTPRWKNWRMTYSRPLPHPLPSDAACRLLQLPHVGGHGADAPGHPQDPPL